MSRVCAIFMLLVLSIAATAQEKRLNVRSFELDPFEMRAKTNPVYDRSGTPSAMIVIHFSALDSIDFNGNIIGRPQQSKGECIVYMPAGSKWIEIMAKGCPILHYDFPEETALLPSRGYILNLEIIEANPIRALMMPVGGFCNSQSSYGLMLGVARRNGGYMKFTSNFRFGPGASLTTDSEGKAKWYSPWFTGKTEKYRWSLTAGYLRSITPSLYLYAGGGYGIRSLLWQFYEAPGKNGYAEVDDVSFSGPAAESGLIMRFGPVAVSAGVNTINFKYWEASAGIGVLL